MCKLLGLLFAPWSSIGLGCYLHSCKAHPQIISQMFVIHPNIVTACPGQRFTSTQIMYEFPAACDSNHACYLMTSSASPGRVSSPDKTHIKIFELPLVRQLTPISLHVQQERMWHRSSRPLASRAAQWLELLLQQTPRDDIVVEKR